MSSTNAPATSTKPSSAKVSSSAGARPTLKNLTRARVPRAAMIGITLATVSAIASKLLISDPHKRDIAAFYKTYDPERDYARMKGSGVFKSLESRERPSWLEDYEQELDTAIASLRSSTGSSE